MAETELERAERRFTQAKARLQGLRNREATKQRKLDTRRKVILGGALVDLAARDDAAAAMLDRLIRNLARDQDRAAFTGWDWRAERGGDGADGGSGAGDASAAAKPAGGSGAGDASAAAKPAGGSGAGDASAAAKPAGESGPVGASVPAALSAASEG